MQFPKESVNSIQLNQKRLLALRSLILTLIVLALANIVFTSFKDDKNNVLVLIEQGLEKSAIIKNKLQEHIEKDEQVLFASWDTPLFNSDNIGSVASSKKLRNVSANLINAWLNQEVEPDSVIFYSRGAIVNFEKQIKKFPFPVNWIIVPSEMGENSVITNVREINSDSLMFQLVESTENGTKQKWKAVEKKTEGDFSNISWNLRGDSIEITNQSNLKVANANFNVLIVIDPEKTEIQTNFQDYLNVALNSLSDYHYQEILIESISSIDLKTDSISDFDLVIWCADSLIPHKIPDNKVLLIEKTNSNTQLTYWYTTNPFRILKKLYLNVREGRPDVSIAEQLAMLVFQPSDFHLMQLHNTDLRILSQKQLALFSGYELADDAVNTIGKQPTNIPIENLLLIFAGLLILLERWVSVRNLL